LLCIVQVLLNWGFRAQLGLEFHRFGIAPIDRARIFFPVFVPASGTVHFWFEPQALQAAPPQSTSVSTLFV
jgi:hypothetical protein